MNLPGLGLDLTLPTPDVKVDGAKLGRAAVDLLIGRKSISAVAGDLAVRQLYAGIDEITGGGLKEQALRLASATVEARAEWEEWLRTLKYGLLAISGEPGTGKTTCAFDLMDRFFKPEGFHLFCIGVPQELLPRGYKEISSGELSLIGTKLDKAAKEQERILQLFDDGEISRPERDRRMAKADPKHIMADFLPAHSAILVDDAGGYLSSGAADRPINRAIRNLLDIRRHLDLVVLATFQSFANVDVKVTMAADAFLMKRSNSAISGGDRPEILRILKGALEYFEDFQNRKANEGLSRAEIREAQLLLIWVVCPAVSFYGPWRHQRMEGYSEALSQNARVIDADFTATDDDPPPTAA